MAHPLDYPFDSAEILRKRRSFKRKLSDQSDLKEKRIAILGGSTTSEIKNLIEIFLLKEGFRPLFYESEYNRFVEDVMFENQALCEFQPEIIYLHTTSANITRFQKINDNEESIQESIKREFVRFQELWVQIEKKFNCPIIQNNFELPRDRPLGNLDSSDIHGRTHFVLSLNQLVHDFSRKQKNFHINDIFYLSAFIGLEKWHDKTLWYSAKYAIGMEALPLLAYGIVNIIKALLGNAQKCLVLDLDNTLWGGLIGEQGLGGLEIGKDTAVGEAFSEFQNYIKELQERGIILAVCSKNDLEVAKEGFEHPDSILKLSDITVFKANWEPKHENIKAIAKEINIGLGSLVFLDDTPAEREIVSAQLPSVKVPNFGNDVTRYIEILDRSGYFETISISTEDLKRNRTYEENFKRQEQVAQFENYDEFLKSLEMKAEIKPFCPLYMDRITQLINKTNQFNLTTNRFTFPQVEEFSRSSQHLTFYGKLTDKFGDNGLISVMIGNIHDGEILINLWLMSCRVIKREMEYAMFDQLVQESKIRGIKKVKGIYLKSQKNNMVKNLYQDLGFERINHEENGNSNWEYEIPESYQPKNQWIEVST